MVKLVLKKYVRGRKGVYEASIITNVPKLGQLYIMARSPTDYYNPQNFIAADYTILDNAIQKFTEIAEEMGLDTYTIMTSGQYYIVRVSSASGIEPYLKSVLYMPIEHPEAVIDWESSDRGGDLYLMTTSRWYESREAIVSVLRSTLTDAVDVFNAKAKKMFLRKYYIVGPGEMYEVTLKR